MMTVGEIPQEVELSDILISNKILMSICLIFGPCQIRNTKTFPTFSKYNAKMTKNERDSPSDEQNRPYPRTALTILG